MGDFRVRLMVPEDVEQVAALETRIFSDPWSRQGFLDSLALPETLFLVAEDSGQTGIVGYLGMYISLGEAEITNVAVSPEYRRCGAGSRIMEAALAEGAGRGVTRFILEVRVSNRPAILLYERYGFQSVGIRRNFYSHPTEDALLMAAGCHSSQRL